jgi:hypothetical protein
LRGRRRDTHLLLALRGRDADEARLPLNAVALGLEVEQAELRSHVRDDAQPGDEAERIQVLHVHGVRHGHLQPASLLAQRERQVLLRLRGRQQRQHRVGRLLEVGVLRHRIARLLTQHPGQGVDVEGVQLDEQRAQPPTVDELGLERLVELRGRDEALADQECSELFGHVPRILDGFAPEAAPRRSPHVSHPSGRAQRGRPPLRG